jgi:NodT family efflux transporter outer membrane factor (OMF) lipoprotein
MRIAALPAIALLPVIALLPAGCMVGPDYKPPKIDTPARFSTTQPTTEFTRWWETFHDPELNSLIERGLKSNLDLQVAAQRIVQARAQRDIATAAIFPQANTTGGYTRTGISKRAGVGGLASVGGSSSSSGSTGTSGSTGSSGNVSTDALHPNATAGSSSPNIASLIPPRFDLWQAGFDASWEIDVFGGTRRSVEAANADIQAQEESRRDTLITLLGDVGRNYVQVRGLQREIQISHDNVRSQRDTLKLTKSRFAAGLATDLDVARAEAQVNTTEAQIPTFEISLQQSIHALGVLLGESPQALEEELTNVQPIPRPPSQAPIGLPSDLLRRRPDVRRAERQLAAATARIGVATADLFPKFNLTGALGLESQTFKSLADSDSLFWNIGPSVSWPIFDAGRIRANIRVQNALEQQALIQYRQTVLVSLEDVENALTAYTQEQARRQSLQQAVDANRRAVDLATQLYVRGLADFLNVLDAQRDLFASQDQLVQSEQNVSADLVSLYKALGGGWEDIDGAQESREEDRKPE